MHIFTKNINTELSYGDIVIYIWDSFEDDKINSLKTAIKKLRKKIPSDLIENVYGIGYRFIV